MKEMRAVGGGVGFGGFFNRDHSTVIHAHKKIQSLTESDPATDALIKSLSIQIRGI